MAPDVAPIERLVEPRDVEPGAIEDEFARIWREGIAGGADESLVRLCVLNFVAIGGSADILVRFDELMERTPERHPCRGIGAACVPGQERLEASISARCWRPPGGARHVCSEEVVLRGVVGQERALASAVLALLLPDIPVAVWIAGEPAFATDLAEEIVAAADRVLFDSARAADVPAGLAAALAASRSEDLALADLAWGRLTTWRALVAQCFDGAERLRELDRVESIQIAGGGGGPSAEALLLAGWLMARLRLTLADVQRAAGGVRATLYDGSRAVELSVAADPDGERLRSVRMAAPALTAEVESHRESGHLHVRERWDGEESGRTVERMPEDDATLIMRMLDEPGDPVYGESARAALALMTGGGSG